MPLPDAIDPDAGGEGIVFGGNPVGKFAAAAAFFSPGKFLIAEDEQETTGSDVAPDAGITSAENMAVGTGALIHGAVSSFHGERIGEQIGLLSLEINHLFLERFERGLIGEDGFFFAEREIRRDARSADRGDGEGDLAQEIAGDGAGFRFVGAALKAVELANLDDELGVAGVQVGDLRQLAALIGFDFFARAEGDEVLGVGIELSAGEAEGGAGEDAVEAVVIALDYRIELVIVASCAAEREAEHGFADIVDHVVDGQMEFTRARNRSGGRGRDNRWR